MSYTIEPGPDGGSFYTFPSGKKVRIKEIHPVFIHQLQRSFPAPKPPIMKVKNEDGSMSEPFPNYNDPIYQQYILPEWQAEFNAQLTALTIELGVEVEIDSEAVEQLRNFWIKQTGKPLDGTDKYIYVSMILCPDGATFEDFSKAVAARNNPQERGVAAAIETFQSDI